ncbi:hypothetical protein DL446_23340, partial [Shigella flexneri]|nr:hypothetical protein [Shigella flexneri]
MRMDSMYFVFRMAWLLLLRIFRPELPENSRYPAPTTPRKMQRFVCGVIHPGLLLQSLVMIQAGIFSARGIQITASRS